MKNYKFLIPVLLIALYVGSVYMLYDAKATDRKQYNTTLEAARDYREKGIVVDADTYYQNALEQKPSLELYLEIGEFYWETEQVRKATKWGETITEVYPENVEGYEYLLTIYDARKDYAACFDIGDTLSKRQLQSEKATEILHRLEYEFYFNGEYDEVLIFGGSLCPVRIEDHWGYASQTGGQSIGARYTYVGPFSGGLAPVTDLEGNCYFIDAKGNKKHVVLGVENIEQLGLMENELFSLYDGKTWSFYNTQHEMIFGGYEDASAIGNGVAAVKKDGVWSIVDSKGTDLTKATYASVAMDEKQVVYRNERLFVSNGSEYQMINKSGAVIGNDTYQDVCLFFDTTYAAVKMNGSWGFIDKEGNVIIEPQFEEARSFSNGLAAVKTNGKWGFIDVNKEMVIAPQFDDAREFNARGCAFVYRKGEWNMLRLYKTNH